MVGVLPQLTIQKSENLGIEVQAAIIYDLRVIQQYKRCASLYPPDPLVNMLKRSAKYFLVVFVNIAFLTLLLTIWTDDLELIFDDWIRPREFLKILGTSVLLLVTMRIMIAYTRKKNIYSIARKVKISITLTCLISSYLYVTYFNKVFDNRIKNRQLRDQLANKIEPKQGLAYGTQAKLLTLEEYSIISKLKGFPKIPAQATNIQYSYIHDGFLPDYLFTLKFDLPKQLKVDTLHYRNGDFERYRTVELKGNIQRVTYTEGQQ